MDTYIKTIQITFLKLLSQTSHCIPISKTTPIEHEKINSTHLQLLYIRTSLPTMQSKKDIIHRYRQLFLIFFLLLIIYDSI